MTGDFISSDANPRTKLVQTLRRRHVREAERLFVVEGVRAVEDALASGAAAHFLLIREDADWRPPTADIDARWVAGRVFDRLAETETPQPVLGVFAVPELPIPHHESPLYLVADGVRDPGNLGSLLRSAAGAGATAVLLSRGTVDPFNGKVVRAGMGAHHRVAIRPLDSSWLMQLERECPRIVLAEAGGGTAYTEIDWTVPSTVIIGSEAHGPGDEARALATERAAIPLANGMESLNAGVAGSILLFEAVRQRAARRARNA